MKSFGLDLAEGTVIDNLSVASGAVFPNDPNNGEMFYLMDGADDGLYIFQTDAWRRVMIDADADAPLVIGTTSTADQTVLDVTGHVAISGDLKMDADSRIWSYIDAQGNPQSGWRDITCDIQVRGSGTASPTWNVIRNGICGWRFSATAMNEVQMNIHLNHDYALGTPIFIHAHWTTATTPTPAQKVRWGFEYTIAKGHGQEAFPASTIVYVEQSISQIYQHMVAEIPVGIVSDSFEPDTLILCRIFRDGAHVNDTFSGTVFLLTADVHHQVNTFATANKSPNFYAAP